MYFLEFARLERENRRGHQRRHPRKPRLANEPPRITIVGEVVLRGYCDDTRFSAQPGHGISADIELGCICHRQQCSPAHVVRPRPANRWYTAINRFVPRPWCSPRVLGWIELAVPSLPDLNDRQHCRVIRPDWSLRWSKVDLRLTGPFLTTQRASQEAMAPCPSPGPGPFSNARGLFVSLSLCGDAFRRVGESRPRRWA
jgi:hypothetical protein